MTIGRRSHLQMVLSLLGFIALLAAFNTFATICAWRNGINDSRQKVWQTLFVWVVPVLGAALAWTVNRPQIISRARDHIANRDNSLAGVEHSLSHRDATDVGEFGSHLDGGSH